MYTVADEDGVEQTSVLLALEAGINGDVLV
jgi:hypothetical protein